MGYATYGEFALGFYNDVVAHLPFVSSVHNIWRAKQLFHLNYGFNNFRQSYIIFIISIMLYLKNFGEVSPKHALKLRYSVKICVYPFFTCSQ